MGGALFGDIGRTIAQLGDPRFVRVLIRGLVISLVFFVALWLVVGFALGRVQLVEAAWLDRAIDVLGGLAAAWLTIILFPGIVSITLGFFLEDVAAAVEARYYPGLPPARRQSIGEIIATSARLGLIVVALNVVLLPVYLVLLFVPPLNLVLFFGLNGYLLGREFFEVVAFRRLTPPDAAALRRRYRGRVWLAGALVTFLFTLPFINLVTPVVATALMVHQLERVRQRTSMRRSVA